MNMLLMSFITLQWGDVVMDQWIQAESYNPDLSKPIQMRNSGGAPTKGLWNGR